MAATNKVYTRLTRNVAGVASYSSLWLGPDHLMLVTSTGYSERYSRIMFRDVKALFVTPSDRQLWWGVAWGLPAVIFGLRLLMYVLRGEWPWASAVFFGLFMGALVWNYVLGPGCRVVIITGVQTTKLPALVRRRKMRRVMSRIEPLIAAAQADLVQAAVPAPAMAESAPPLLSPTSPNADVPTPTTEPPSQP